ncbi:dehydrogenase [Burkholderia pseudomallei]|uniref:Putative GHMP kinase n=1 Tax=Burkholderia pseudomallei TaxID=28450 RepID=E5GAJ9_BURPE|nr:dehydrogenase [Burkholderia pseudomallei]ADQ27805.1 putative GHMP kinase [Burkholderia pseudomallei]ADQ27833.1 putative GHMP kinase [Burkholderia pseudomallei]ADQ27855.1 putative GHMP kinase [Burkholderia pseudomallei]OAB20126.1 dehydrogenase [Burkholderia pseudomallei]
MTPMSIGQKRDAVRARAPLRLGLAGGGTDVSPYSDDFGGLVLNATIDRYAYATIVPRQDDTVELVAADNSVAWSGPMAASLALVEGLELHVGVYNRVVRDYNGGKPLAVQVTTHSEAPPGSGLGSSSTMVVALLHAFVEYLQIPLGEYEIAHLAYDIERIDLALAGGKQDQYAAAFGGFNFMEFYKDRVIVNPLRVKQSVLAELESALVLFYTGVSRESAKIIREQTESMQRGHSASVEAMHRVKQEAVHMKEAILKGDFDSFAESMRLSWESKKKMAASISNAHIDAIYDAAIAAGARAGKVSGAGGGGFMMFIVDPTKRPDVIRALQRFSGQAFTCNFTKHGAYSWRT